MTTIYWTTTTPNDDSDCIGYAMAPEFFLTLAEQQQSLRDEIEMQTHGDEEFETEYDDDGNITLVNLRFSVVLAGSVSIEALERRADASF